MDNKKGDHMDLIYMIGLFICSIMGAYIMIKMQDENLFGNRSKIFDKIRILEVKQKTQDDLINSNIESVGKANQRITELKKDLACYTEKVDRTDSEIDHLQEHCVKLRESIIDIKELVSSKRPIIKVPPIQVTLPVSVVTTKKKK